MAKEFYDWIKLALDNKWLLMLCLGGASSLATNLNQYFIGQEDDFTKRVMVEQITILAKPKKIQKKAHKSNCGVCQTLMNEHKIREH